MNHWLTMISILISLLFGATASAQETQLVEAAKKGGRQSHSLRVSRTGYDRPHHQGVCEENRPASGLLARFDNQSR